MSKELSAVAKKLILELTEVENGYFIRDTSNDPRGCQSVSYVAETLESLLKVIQELASDSAGNK